MRTMNPLAHAALLAAVLATAGCTAVAAGIAGGALLGIGGYAISDSSQRTVSAPIEEVEAAARDALAELDVTVVDDGACRTGNMITRRDLGACLVGDRVIPVDIVLERLSDQMTSVQVSARSGWFRPEQGTAEEILNRIVNAAEQRGLEPESTAYSSPPNTERASLLGKNR